MEQILAKLIEPDNSAITQGTLELQEALSKPEAIGELCNVVVSSQNSSIRHYAAVVLRKKLCKSVNWNKVSLSDREIIKNGILKALVDEPEKQVKKAICQFIAHVANHELPNNNWNQLIQFLEEVNTSNDLAQRELGMYALGIILDISGENFKQPEKQASLCNLFNSTLESIPDMSEPLAYLTVLAMHHYLTACDTPNLNYNWKKVYETVQAQAAKRPDRALECLDLIDDLMEMENLSAQHVSVAEIATLVLHLAGSSDDDDLQEKALNVLSSVVKAKVKPNFYTKNNGLLEKTVDVLLKLMSVPPLDDSCEDYYIDQDANAPSVYAASTLDDMAIHIPPTKLMAALQDKVVAYLTSPDPYWRKGGYIALAAVTEGASAYIGNHHMQVFVDFALRGIVDEHPVVQNAAFFALGQMSEYLQPQIATFGPQIMPILLNFLSSVSNALIPPDNTKHVERMFYALEAFIDTMEAAVSPYVPALMEATVKILENPTPACPLEFKEFAIRTIGSIATAIETEFLPYFPNIMTHLAACVNSTDLKGQGDDHAVSSLQNSAVEVIGTLARATGEENFRPYAHQSVELGLRMLSSAVDDPETAKVAFQLFASVATILKQDMVYLPNIIELLVSSIENDNEYVARLKEEDGLDVFVGDEDNEEESEDVGNEEDIDFDETRSEEDDDVEGYTYDCSKLDEKEEALDAVREIAKVTGPAFTQYLQQSFDAVYRTLYHPHEGVRGAAVETLVQLCTVQSPGPLLAKCLDVVVPKLREIISTDESKDVVIKALGGLRDVLSELGPAALASEGHLEAVHNALREVINKKTKAQRTSFDEEEDEEAEREVQVVESAGEVLPALSKAVPSEVFAKIAHELLGSLCTRLKRSQLDDENTEALKSFIVGTIAECIPGLEPHIGEFIPSLLPLLVKFSRDKSSDIRQNSLYGLGVLAGAAKESLAPHYPSVLEILADALGKEKPGAVLDNAMAALCRMIAACPGSVPIDRVLPVLIDTLPITEDLEETRVVLECLCMLYNSGNSILQQHLGKVLAVLIVMLADHEQFFIKSGLKDATVQFIGNVIRDFPQLPETALGGLTPPQQAMYASIRQTLS
ncbi:hypothetical protein M8J77_017187 [Diaphorina citri]|nr:hypothetical protein M8J77_017187 [Diaphorina citri]